MNRESGSPRGTVAFLLTDIERSTWLWEQAPAEMDVAYQQHDAILNEVAERFGGVVFKIVGDAFQLAFPDTDAAAAAAVEAQRRLHAASWGLPRPLRVRMSIHCCAAEPASNGDYRTPALNRAGRLLAAGHGGQILLSASAVAGLRRLPADVTIRDLGERQLRDLPRREHVYQLVAGDLPAQFPPLDTIDRRPSELPWAANRLIGRQEQLRSVQRLIRSGERRLVTLTGPGGVGKSRLALEIAAGMVDDFEFGAHWISLVPVAEPRMIVPAVAAHFGIVPEGEATLDEAVAGWLRDREILLVLDNCEHLLDAGELVARWLKSSPRLTILATSRVRLWVRAESVVPVEPLALPGTECASLDELAESPSGELFLERVRSGGVSPTEDDVAAIGAICRALDGLPLALELAGAREDLPDFKQLAERLTNRLAELTGGPRDLPARHRTLRGTIEWSYGRLTAEQQAVFRRMSIFHGQVSADEAAQVCGLATEPLARVLDALADQSLLTASPEAPRRYGMLETIREFGLDALAARGEIERAGRDHALLYAAVARSIEPVLTVTVPKLWLEKIDRAIANLYAAMRWGMSGGDPAITLLIASALDYYWWAKGQRAEGLTWIERALEAAVDVPPLVRCDGLRARGILLRANNAVEEAERALAQALALAREEREHPSSFAPPLHVSVGVPGAGDERSLAETVPGFRAIGGSVWLRTTLASYGLALIVLGRGHDALDVVSQMASLLDDAEDDSAGRYRLCQIEILACRVLGRAVDPALITELLRLTEESGAAYLRSGALQISASAALDAGNPEAAALLLAEALALQLDLDDGLSVAELLNITARLAASAGHLEPAARFLAMAEHIAASLGIETFPFTAIDHAAASAMLRPIAGAFEAESQPVTTGPREWRQVAQDARDYVTTSLSCQRERHGVDPVRPLRLLSTPAAD